MIRRSHPCSAVRRLGDPWAPREPRWSPRKCSRTAQLVTENYDRSRAMEEVAREAILSNQLLLAHHILEQAATAALKEENSLRHDQLIIEAITTTALLTETLIREGKCSPCCSNPTTRDRADSPETGPEASHRLALLEWQRAAFLARQIDSPTYRSEYLARVVEGMGKDSTRIVIEYVRIPDRTSNELARRTRSRRRSLPNRRMTCWSRPPGSQPRSSDPSGETRPSTPPPSPRASRNSSPAPRASPATSRIPRRARHSCWSPKSQCRQNQDEQATKTYSEVVDAVARVQQNGLRGVLTGYLVDSLTRPGRFEDARAALVLYPTESERFVALEAIAESQGRRGAAASAREWIAQEARPEYRSALYRRVNSGVLTAIETERSSLYLGKDAQQAPPPK